MLTWTTVFWPDKHQNSNLESNMQSKNVYQWNHVHEVYILNSRYAFISPQLRMYLSGVIILFPRLTKLSSS